MNSWKTKARFRYVLHICLLFIRKLKSNSVFLNQVKKPTRTSVINYFWVMSNLRMTWILIFYLYNSQMLPWQEWPGIKEEGRSCAKELTVGEWELTSGRPPHVCPLFAQSWMYAAFGRQYDCMTQEPNTSGTDHSSEAPDRHKGARLLLQLQEMGRHKGERAVWHELEKGLWVHLYSLRDYWTCGARELDLPHTG